MATVNIYKDIAKRTGGDIYIGVVGPVRTGKSTFIKQFMDKLVMPNLSEEQGRDRALAGTTAPPQGLMLMGYEYR